MARSTRVPSRKLFESMRGQKDQMGRTFEHRVQGAMNYCIGMAGEWCRTAAEQAEIELNFVWDAHPTGSFERKVWQAALDELLLAEGGK